MARRSLGVAALIAGALVAAACSSVAPGPALTPTLDPGRGILGGTDTDRHSVSLADIHFDTFAGFSLALSEIDEERLLLLRDRIPPA